LLGGEVPAAAGAPQQIISVNGEGNSL